MTARAPKAARGAIAICAISLASLAWGAESRIHVIDVDGLAFGPASEVLHVNDIVEWVNQDMFRHTATASDGSFDIDLPTGGKGRTTLRQAGVVSYFCRFHPGMKDRLEVAP